MDRQWKPKMLGFWGLGFDELIKNMSLFRFIRLKFKIIDKNEIIKNLGK